MQEGVQQRKVQMCKGITLMDCHCAVDYVLRRRSAAKEAANVPQCTATAVDVVLRTSNIWTDIGYMYYVFVP